ncbi:MAG: HAD-IIB family hydrolase [Planctomycetes bacterium]|nr:HAD-IIB family hydrolase [Planctomycetota bacterium]
MSSSPLEGVRLVALDLDGTLLPGSKVLTPRARDVVRGLGDAGIAVTLATGRGWTHTSRYANELGLTGPLVTFEGALVAARCEILGRRVLHHRSIHADLIRRVARAVEDLGLGWFVCMDDGAGGRTVASHGLAHRATQIAIWDPVVEFVETDIEHAWLEADARGFILHLVGPPNAIREAFRRMHEAAFDDVDCFRAEFWDGFDQLQIRPLGIGKHIGLAHVLDEMGLGPDQLLAAGDWHNDVEMLQMARVAVAPANAIAEVRAIADHVLSGTSEDDAVIRFLESALSS